ncbi:hypothetical protein F4779DRAFT_560742 [Xylariaceae sp. FL0662B]|nr:hypothetical protein F4779DRAFT_560742 [Xylariaceae sp. FL0662B]
MLGKKSVLGALCAGNGAFETATRRIARQHRTFTSTAQRNASIARFTPTSTTELDNLLDTIREKIILPSYLPIGQRKKIYSPKYEKKLQSDPIIIEIDQEIFKFRHLNPFNGDIPEARRSVMSAIQQFETPEDFANLRPLLEGVAHTGYNLDPSFYCKIVRVVGRKGHIHDLIECARGVRRTNLKLDSSEKANEVMHWVQMKAIESQWDEEETRQALRWAEMVIDMLQSDEHQPARRKDEAPIQGELPLSRDPMVLLAPLHLAAALVSKYEPKEEIVEQLNKHANDIVRLWPEGKKLTEVQPKELYEKEHGMGYLRDLNKFVTLAAPLMYGLETAVKVVEPPLASQLQSRLDLLAAEVQEARRAISMKPGRGEAVYRQLYGE